MTDKIIIDGVEVKQYDFKCIENNDKRVVFKDIIGHYVATMTAQRDKLMMDEIYRKAPDNFLLEVKQIIDKEIKARGLNEAILRGGR